MRRGLILLLCLSLLAVPARGEEAPKYVALTFDDGPSGRFTRNLLRELKEEGVKATFFLCGYRMEKYPDITQAIFREGHEIGYHGYSHGNMLPMSRRDIAGEIGKMEALLPQGCRMTFLRPPGGLCGEGVTQVAEARGLAVLSWSVDPRDWATRDAWAVEKTVVERVRDGDVVLLHDMSDSSVAAAMSIVRRLKERGFRFVTVSELAALRKETIRPGEVYRSFPPG